MTTTDFIFYLSQTWTKVTQWNQDQLFMGKCLRLFALSALMQFANKTMTFKGMQSELFIVICISLQKC